MSWLWIAGTLGDYISLSLSLTKIEFPPSHQMATLLFMDYIYALEGGRLADKVFPPKTCCMLFQLHRGLQSITSVFQQTLVYPIRKITEYFRGLRIVWSAKRLELWKRARRQIWYVLFFMTLMVKSSLKTSYTDVILSIQYIHVQKTTAFICYDLKNHRDSMSLQSWLYP